MHCVSHHSRSLCWPCLTPKASGPGGNGITVVDSWLWRAQWPQMPQVFEADKEQEEENPLETTILSPQVQASSLCPVLGLGDYPHPKVCLSEHPSQTLVRFLAWTLSLCLCHETSCSLVTGRPRPELMPPQGSHTYRASGPRHVYHCSYHQIPGFPNLATAGPQHKAPLGP